MGWDEALELVAGGLEAAKEKGGNESVMMYHYSAQHTLPGGRDAEPATIMRLLNMWGGAVQPYMRGSLCWKAFLGASDDVFGHWQVSNRPSDDCEWIVLWGNNPVETGYRGLLQSLQNAKKKGARFIVVDPLRTRTVERFGDIHVPIRPSTDTALALAVLRLMLAEDALDEAFLGERTNAAFLVDADTGRFVTAPDGAPLVWDEETASAKPFGACEKPALSGTFEVNGTGCRPALDYLRDAAESWTPERAARECDVSKEHVHDIARAMRRGKVIVYYGSYQRTVHGEQAVRALHILNLMAGASGGVLRHGAREAGFPSDRAHGTGLVEVMTDRWALPNPVKRTIPTGQIAEAILNPDSHGGPVNAALVMWGNPVGQAGNAHKTERALRSLDFCAVADVFMTPTAKCADVVLPASTWLERCAITEGMEAGSTFYHLAHELTPKHILIYTPGVMPPRGESLDDFEIVCRLAEKMGYGAHFPWKSSREWTEELLEAARADARFPWLTRGHARKARSRGADYPGRSGRRAGLGPHHPARTRAGLFRRYRTPRAHAFSARRRFRQRGGGLSASTLDAENLFPGEFDLQQRDETAAPRVERRHPASGRCRRTGDCERRQRAPEKRLWRDRVRGQGERGNQARSRAHTGGRTP